MSDLIIEAGANILSTFAKKYTDKKQWQEIFIGAGDTIAEYENRAEDEQSELRVIVFSEGNMIQLADHLYEINDFDFQNELERCLDSLLNSSGLSVDNQLNCKKHFMDIVMNDIKDHYAILMEHIQTQETNLEVKRLGEDLGEFNDKINRVLSFLEGNIPQADGKEYQRHNNRKAPIGSAVDRKVKWTLSGRSHLDPFNSTKEQAWNVVKIWEEERKKYPGWFLIPCDVSMDVYYHTTLHVLKFVEQFTLDERLIVVYELVWRHETGMISYDIYLQRQVYEVWQQCQALLNGTEDDSEYLEKWFFIGRALLREFREDAKEKEWKKVWTELNKYVSRIEYGELFLQMDEIQYQFSIYHMDKVRRKLQRLVIPKQCYEIRLTRIGLEMQCGNLEFAQTLVTELITDLECSGRSDQVSVGSIRVMALQMHSFILQGVAWRRGEYEQHQEEINVLLDKIDKASDYFDFEETIHSLRRGLLEWQIKRREKKESFGLNTETRRFWGEDVGCREAYYFYRVLDKSSFPLVCNHVNFFGNIELPWLLALYESFPDIALHLMLRCSKSDIGEYILTRSRLIQEKTEDISQKIRYLMNTIEYCLDEFEELSVDVNDSVCHPMKYTIPGIFVRYLSRCPDDLQPKVLQVTRKIMGQPNVVMDDRMDRFLYGITNSISEKMKGQMLDDLIQMGIVEHKVMHGHWPSVDLFSYYFHKEASGKYCKRTSKIETGVLFLLSDEDDDMYTWRTKIKRLWVLDSVGLLTQKERDVFSEKLWSRLHPETNLPDIPDWYIYRFLDYGHSDSRMPAVSIKACVLSQRLMLTMAKEEGCHISMGKITYIEEMRALNEEVPKDFWTMEEVGLIFRDAMEYWEILKEKIQKNRTRAIVNDEYERRIHNIVIMLADLYDTVTGKISSKFSEQVLAFANELEQYHVSALVLRLLFESEDNLPALFEKIVEHMYDVDQWTSLEAMMAAYRFVDKFPDQEASNELLENMIFVLQTRKEPGLVSMINLLHNLIYNNNAAVTGPFIHKLDKCLLTMEEATAYKDDDEKTVKQKALIRKCCAGLAYQMAEKHPKDIGPGVALWEKVCSGDEFAEVKNEMLFS